MLAFRHPGTGQVQIAASAAGYDDWEAIDAPPAADGYVWADGAWTPDLATARARQRAIINAARDAAQDGGATVAGVGTFDTAERSRQFLNGAVAAAQIALANQQPFEVEWTLADDSTVTLDAEGVISAGLAIAGHVGTIHQRARVLKGRIDAAETLAAIAAIGWTLTDPE